MWLSHKSHHAVKTRPNYTPQEKQELKDELGYEKEFICPKPHMDIPKPPQACGYPAHTHAVGEMALVS